MESAWLARLAKRFGADPRLAVPLGDDAAVLHGGGEAPRDWVATTDMLMDGVDFHLGLHTPERIGRKSLAVNLSDLAAMGAEPTAALIALALPRVEAPSFAASTGSVGGDSLPSSTEELAARLYDGLVPLAEEFGVAIAGGDTNVWDHPLVISPTLLGQVPRGRPFTRSGGRPGDWLLTTGPLGGSIRGRHFDFQPRVGEALALARRNIVRAAIDISDGLSLDASRLAAASGCGALLLAESIPISADAHSLASEDPAGGTALEHALADGEDFELLLAIDPRDAEPLLGEQPLVASHGVLMTHIGHLTAEPGLWLQRGDAREALAPRGWLHG